MKYVIHFFFQGEFGVPSPEESGAWLSFIAFINIPKMWGWVNCSAYARKNFVWQFEYVPRFITVLPWIWQTWFLIRIITTLVNKYWMVWIIKSSSIVAKLHLRWNVTSKIITSSGNSWKDYTNWNSCVRKNKSFLCWVWDSIFTEQEELYPSKRICFAEKLPITFSSGSQNQKSETEQNGGRSSTVRSRTRTLSPFY